MKKWLTIPVTLIVIFYSCEKPIETRYAPITFSEDTIFFDTLFTTIGSTRRELRLKNESRNILTVDNIFLAGGENSPFRINIDGEPLLSKNNVLIYPGDSIFIFVDVIINPLNSDLPVLVTDSIIFDVNGSLYKVILYAYGQDIILKKDATIGTETWDHLKPYVIYGNAFVDTFQTLTIEKGVRLYFHKNSSLTVAGNIIVNGTFEKPVLFASDRLEKDYMDVPGQWKGIFILQTSKDNVFNHAVIRNATYGIRLGEPEKTENNPLASLKINYVDISHSGVTGLEVYSGTVKAVNSVFSHCGTYCVYIASEGEHSFIHCTLFNMWEYGIRFTPLFYVTEKSPAGNQYAVNLTMVNSVVYGDLPSELKIVQSASASSGTFSFDHCLLKLDTLKDTFWNRNKFPGTVINIEPRFMSKNNYDLRPDTLSPLINAGSKSFLNLCSDDFRGRSRLADGMPDIGAYERIPGETKNRP